MILFISKFCLDSLLYNILLQTYLIRIMCMVFDVRVYVFVCRSVTFLSVTHSSNLKFHLEHWNSMYLLSELNQIQGHWCTALHSLSLVTEQYLHISNTELKIKNISESWSLKSSIKKKDLAYALAFCCLSKNLKVKEWSITSSTSFLCL